MATAPTQVRIDADVKKEAAALSKDLGLDMSTAVNLLLHQCVLRGGIPFTIEKPMYNSKTLDAMEEAKKISADPAVKSYSSMEELERALEE